MEHAALAALQRLNLRFKGLLERASGCLLAGPGNNGGDALALARLLALAGNKRIVVYALPGQKSISYEIQKKMLEKINVPIVHKLTETHFDFIVDGLFGTGLSRPLEREAISAVEWTNARKNRSWILALDIPTGLNSDNGQTMPLAVEAAETVTFGFYKKGLVTGVAADYCGKITLAPLQIPRMIPEVRAEAFLIEKKDVQLPERKAASHKGDHGHVYITAGIPQMEGAACLSATGALRGGAGWTSLVGEDSSLQAVRPRLLPEIMTTAFSESLFQKRAVAVIGPGLGAGEPRWKLLKSYLISAWPLVLDADAFQLISQNEAEALKIFSQRKSRTVMTPHPKEAAALLTCTVDEIQNDRYGSAKKIADKFFATCLLKGKGTIIASPEEGATFVVDRGSPVLAKGGSGDVLAGLIAALLSQGLDAKQAAITGAYVHGRAAELLTQAKGESITGIASELTEYFSLAMSEL